MRESVLVRKIRAAVKAKYPYAYCRKIADRFTRGIPDIIIVFRRQLASTRFHAASILFVETKAKKGRVSAIQAAEHEAIMAVDDNGCSVVVARTVEDVLSALEQMGAVP